MGRTPKYFTVDEAAAGHRARVGNYGQSPRGKQARAAARQPRYSRKKAKTSRRPLSPPPPPADVAVVPRDPRIAQWRAFPLPDEEELFMDALHGSRGRDFSPLEAWIAEPPFADDDDDRDPHNLAYLSYTHNLKIALHGLRLRQEQADDIRRRAAFAAGEEEGKAAQQEELRELLSRWSRVVALPAYAVETRKYAMYVHYTGWLARTIHRLDNLEFLVL
ncbi:hypothetical protein B0H11DRAFT_2223492 [Mycena galericulata]|nr:hypothetical protein B0H11DRAFT_2223492 [Mycena galericulata]